jgi:hypothetical protein
MNRWLVAGVLALLAGSSVAQADEPKLIRAQVGSIQSKSGWSEEKAGMIVVKDADAYLKTLKLIYGRDLERIDPQPFNDDYVYLYIFAGKTNSGGGNAIEAVTVSRFGPNRDVDRIQVQARVIEEGAGGGLIQIVQSRWLLVKVAKKDLGGEITAETRFKLRTERLRRLGSADSDPVSPPR